MNSNQRREKISQTFVITRSGIKEKVSFDKILERLERLSDGLNVDSFHIAQDTIKGLYTEIKTSELDELTAELCSSLKLVICINKLLKITLKL